jgi:hypothetical protein
MSLVFYRYLTRSIGELKMTELTNVELSNEAVVLLQPTLDFEKLAKDEIAILKALEGFAITTQGDADFISKMVAEAKGRYNHLEEQRKQIGGPAFEFKKLVDAKFKLVTDVLLSTEKAGKYSGIEWNRKVQEEARIAQIEADKKAAAEREKLAAQAAEAMKAAQAAEATLQSQELTDIQQDELNAKAQQAREQSNALQQQAQVVMAAPPVLVARTKGVTFVEKWQAEVFDKPSAIKFLAASPEYHYMLMIDERILLNQAKIKKADLKIDGVRVWDAGSQRVKAA